MATAKKAEVVEIKPVELRNVTLKIVGDTPLIVHAWSEKAKRMMLEAQMGLAKGKKKEAKTKCSGDCANCANAEKEGK